MPEKTLGASVDTDTSLYEGFEEYAENYRSNSEAVREALRVAMEQDGLEAREESAEGEQAEQGDEGRMLAAQLVLFVGGASLLVAAFCALLPLLGPTPTGTAVTLAVVFTALSVVASLRAGQLANTSVVGPIVGLDAEAGQETEAGS
jgi:VIT1/CCC1 family predicted Fe2+/Mn2+ transporter